MDLNQPSEITPAQPTLEQLLQLLEQPAVCARLQQMVSEGQNRQTSRWQRVSAFVAGASSTLVVLLAFLIPSLQEQWNQYQSRRVLERHVELGRAFMREGKYALAEKSFAKAFELSESKRLDIEEERLKAKVQAVNADPLWGAKNPEGLDEADFLYLLQLQRAPAQATERAATLNCYGTFLASEKRYQEAEEQLRAAVKLNPAEVTAQVNLGNLLRQQNKLKEAEAVYRTALQLDTHNASVHYDLGVVLAELNHPAEAETELRNAVADDPADADLLRTLAQQLKANGKHAEARQVLSRLPQLAPNKPSKPISFAPPN
ncbi:MAG TPA: tetratricopeptide repeat protein [Blastocatellia bacterium]|nr:tetratricopeptide repeat protein [Blastocatellia bacterium]HMX26736.1 tetratricopeptide repeat protein [Blastocatellia bacterium]HMY72037.1 tetratricopeptide repeat protein [Blastocatellia bacterium]HMZ20801.1 tetratricopeptide repeat protein [Blastocatellia bacterium]HNG30036.1 tetratricopeptide repeat protein [Blastocatellia bacterium]